MNKQHEKVYDVIILDEIHNRLDNFTNIFEGIKRNFCILVTATPIFGGEENGKLRWCKLMKFVNNIM